MPSSRYYSTEYTYDIIDINESILNKIKKKLDEGKDLIESACEETISPKHMAWVKSFHSIIQEIDPFGEIDTWGSEHSDSLIREWHHAQYAHSYSSHEITELKITKNVR